MLGSAIPTHLSGMHDLNCAEGNESGLRPALSIPLTNYCLSTSYTVVSHEEFGALCACCHLIHVQSATSVALAACIVVFLSDSIEH